MAGVFQCKKKSKPLLHAPQPSSFVWGEKVEKSIAKLRDSGWTLKSKGAQEVLLVVPLEILEKEKNLPILKDMAKGGAPKLAQISLYPEKGKLMLARLNRIDTKEQVENYRENLLEAYKLKKAIWSAQGKSSKDKTGNTHKSQTALYEQKELFVLLRDFSMEPVEEDLAKGRNYGIEVLFYNKKNPGLNSKSLIEQLETEKK